MIKIKTNYKEIREFSRYLQLCLLNDAKTIDKVKEYFLAFEIGELNLQLVQKLLQNAISQKPDYTCVTIKINSAQILALSIYFKRYQLHSFLANLERDILNKMPSEIINVLNQTKKYEATYKNNGFDFD